MEHRCIALINSAGLISDIIGVCVLFFDRDKFLTRISKTVRKRNITYRERNELQRPSPSNNGMRENIENVNTIINSQREDINSIINELNVIIETVRENNDNRFRKSRLWLSLIILGFLLQILSVYLYAVEV